MKTATTFGSSVMSWYLRLKAEPEGEGKGPAWADSEYSDMHIIGSDVAVALLTFSK